MINVAVFASGGGTNLQALLDRFGADGDGVARIVLVISDREGAGALDRARRAGVAARVVSPAGLSEETFGHALLEELEAFSVDLVVLAGYTRLVPETVVRAYRARILNIHPSLLPAFGGQGMYGARVHRAVLEAGCRVSGVTVHRVDERYDTGPILAQWPVPVLPGDSPETLAARVLRVEHRLLPTVIEVVARSMDSGGASSRTERGQAEDPVAYRIESADAPSGEEIRRVLDAEVWSVPAPASTIDNTS